MKNRIKRFMTIAFLLCFSFCIRTAPAAAATEKVRVGYMDYEGFITPDGNGNFEGYGAAYLNKVAQYTDWEYEYVFGTWSNLLLMLQEGTIDLVCAAQYTEERAALYDYSQYSMGQESTVIYVLPDNDDIYYEDYKAMDQKRIGMLRGSYQNRVAEKLEKDQGITLHEVFYESDQEVMNALSEGSVDLALLGELALHNNLKIVAQLGSSPFYFITNKGKPELLKTLDRALEQINTFSPYFEEGIYKKYYGAGNGCPRPLITREEQSFIENTGPIRIGCIEGFVPLCYRNPDTREADGILPALVTAAVKKSGLPFEIVLLKDNKDIMEYIHDGEVDLLAGVVYEKGLSDYGGLTVSEPILDETLVMLAKTGDNTSVEGGVKIALPNQLSYLERRLSAYFPRYEIRYYDTVEDCIDSIVTDENDITLQNNYVANYYLQRKLYQGLTATSFLDFDDPLAFVGKSQDDSRLISVINKSIPCISLEERSEILTEFSIGNPYEDSVADLLWYYRYSVMIIVALLGVIAGVTILLHSRRTKMMLARKEADAYRRISERDILTGVYNRQMFYVRAREALDQNPDIRYQLIYLNIENFKLVNDLFGTGEGDRILIHTANWIRDYAQQNSGVAGRLDADHFILCVPSQTEQGELVVHLLQEELKKISIDMDITVNCGVYTVVEGTRNVQLMCDRAHLAANDSKGNVLKPVSYYSDAHRERLMQVQSILNEMRTALDKKQFQIHLQPQIDMSSGRLIGAEALVRWVHPERGVIAPGSFIPVFEQNGFIAKLDLYVFEEVCRLQKRWKEEGRKPIPISVNLSRVNFYSRTLREQLLRILDLYGVEPGMVELELTESAYAVDDHEIFNRLRQLQSDGFRILMDDFGSGYSALNMLKDAPVDILKLDLRFLYKSDPYHRSWQILKSILSMTEALDIPVIAEGVETFEQVEVLSKTGCYAAQGYYYSRPVEVAQFEAAYLS